MESETEKEKASEIIKKVLIVEDEELIRDALRDKFELSGFQVALAKNGEEGLEQALRIHPNIIILDILMPKMDGIAMLKRLRADVWGINAPVIVLTNINDYHQLEEALLIGVDEYIVKAEWQLKDIVAKVKSILGMG